jgi:hypothetical protein
MKIFTDFHFFFAMTINLMCNNNFKQGKYMSKYSFFDLESEYDVKTIQETCLNFLEKEDFQAYNEDKLVVTFIEIFEKLSFLHCYDVYEEIIKKLKYKQPQFYTQNFDLLEQDQFEYHVYMKNEKKINDILGLWSKDYQNYPFEEYNYSLPLLYNAYNDLFIEHIKIGSKKFQSDFKHVLFFDFLHKKKKNNEPFNEDEIYQFYSQFDVVPDKEYVSEISTYITEKIDLINIKTAFTKTIEHFYELQLFFCAYMHHKGMSLFYAYELYDCVFRYFRKSNSFDFDIDVFSSLLDDYNSNTDYSYLHIIFLTSWNLEYVYEFLREYDLIDQNTYDATRPFFEILKAQTILKYNDALWMHKFCLDLTDERKNSDRVTYEAKIFDDSFTYRFNDDKFIDYVENNLSNLPKFKKNILQCYSEIEKDNDLFAEELESFLGTMENETFNSDEFNALTNIHAVEQRKVIKIGRNEPCPCGSGKKYKKCCGKIGQK